MRAAFSLNSSSSTVAISHLFLRFDWSRTEGGSVGIANIGPTFQSGVHFHSVRFRNSNSGFTSQSVFPARNGYKRPSFKGGWFSECHLRQLGWFASEREILAQ